MSVLEGVAVLGVVAVWFVVCVAGLFIRIERMGSHPQSPQRLSEPPRALSRGSVIEATYRTSPPVPVAHSRAGLPAGRP